jgi:hypothetical protein
MKENHILSLKEVITSPLPGPFCCTVLTHLLLTIGTDAVENETVDKGRHCSSSER